MTALQFWYQKGDIVEIIEGKTVSPHLGGTERIWHPPGSLGTVIDAPRWEPADSLGDEPIVPAQLLTLKFTECKCPRSRVHPYCMTVPSNFVQIHPSSPRFKPDRWGNFGKGII